MRAYLTAFATLAFVTSPFWSGSFSGFTAGQTPIEQTNPPIQPAGYAFSIWGVIYVWLVVSAAYGVWQRRDDVAWDAARPALIASLAFGTPWLWIAQNSVIWATVFIWGMLVTALWALYRAPKSDGPWFAWPIGLYAGWLTAASFVALAVLLAGYGIGPDATTWAMIGIPVAAIVALSALWATGSIPYAAAVIWALVAITVKNADDLSTVAALAGGSAALLAIAAFLRSRRPAIAS